MLIVVIDCCLFQIIMIRYEYPAIEYGLYTCVAVLLDLPW